MNISKQYACFREIRSRIAVASGVHFCLWLLAVPASAQCPGHWTSGAFGFPAFNGDVVALVKLPNGDLVAGGTFTAVGANPGIPANHIARWNGTAWMRLGSGVNNGTNNTVIALKVLPRTGELVVGGGFTSAGGVPGTSFIASYNPATDSWSAMGSGMNQVVRALALMPNNIDLVAGGDFTASGTLAVNKVASWNGTAWSPLALGIGGSIGTVHALAVKDGDLVAGGTFPTAGVVSANNIARWNGTAWSPLGTTTSNGLNGAVNAMEVLAGDGDLVVGGEFTTIGAGPAISAMRLARWNGTTLSPFGSGASNGTMGTVYALLPLTNGDLMAGGAFVSAGGVSAVGVALWHHAMWFPCGAGIGVISGLRVEALAMLSNSDVAVGGSFSSAGGFQANSIAKFSLGCPADFNCAAGVTMEDIFDYLNAYFTVNSHADFNGVGGVTVQDIFDFLIAYFTPCP